MNSDTKLLLGIAAVAAVGVAGFMLWKKSQENKATVVIKPVEADPIAKADTSALDQGLDALGKVSDFVKKTWGQ